MSNHHAIHLKLCKRILSVNYNWKQIFKEDSNVNSRTEKYICNKNFPGELTAHCWCKKSLNKLEEQSIKIIQSAGQREKSE